MVVEGDWSLRLRQRVKVAYDAWYEDAPYNQYGVAVLRIWLVSVDPSTGLAWTWCRDE